ncbi:MAG TPA: hypothetical protein VFJ58_07695 [Armatimonadota bacterium]|nr:hypothetical protein [Armatimonadota bacterium]
MKRHSLPLRRTALTTVGIGVAIAITAASALAATVAFEAESANTITHPFQVITDSRASGHKCVVQPLHSGRPPQVNCAATYKVRITQPGRYHIWGRALWPNGCANSVYVRLDKGPLLTLGQDGTYNRWHWVEVKGHAFTLTRGVHTFQMVNREDGPEMDEFYFTTDEDYVPVGAERTLASVIVR